MYFRTRSRVIAAVEGAMAAGKDKVVKWPDDVQFILFGYDYFPTNFDLCKEGQ